MGRPGHEVSARVSALRPLRRPARSRCATCLTHRSGLSRGDLLLFDPHLTRDSILYHVRYLKPTWSLRSHFGYPEHHVSRGRAAHLPGLLGQTLGPGDPGADLPAARHDRQQHQHQAISSGCPTSPPRTRRSRTRCGPSPITTSTTSVPPARSTPTPSTWRSGSGSSSLGGKVAGKPLLSARRVR